MVSALAGRANNQRRTAKSMLKKITEKENCTCPYTEDTAQEIGHIRGCPLYGVKTWWREKEDKKKEDKDYLED